MAPTKRVWRVAPSAFLAETVHNLALAENRSDANMISVLIGEAVAARRAIEQRKPEIVRLADLIRGGVQAQ